jgi:hypothetical protein
MAVFAFTNAKLVLNSVDLSDHVAKVTLKTGADVLETTAMQTGSTPGYKTRTGGLFDFSVDIEWRQDHAASKVDATLWPLLGTVTTISINPFNAANAATNPNYSGSVLVSEYSPMDGAVGDLAGTSTSWNGSGALTRATS